MALKWILIDLDNTLVASNPRRLKLRFLYSYFQIMQRRGLRFWPAFRLLRKMEKALSTPNGENNLNRVAKYCPPEISKSQLQEIFIEIFQRMLDEFQPIPGASDFVRALKGKYSVVLATNPIWPLAVTEMRLAKINLHTSDFDLVTHQENMSHVKPDLGYFQELVKKLGANASECLMIGDNPKKDGPARTLGMQVKFVHQNKSLVEQLKGVLDVSIDRPHRS